MANKELLHYLKNVVELEKAIYVQSESIESARQYANSLGYPNYIQEPELEGVHFDTFEKVCIGVCFGVAVGASIGLFFGGFLRKLLLFALIGGVVMYIASAIIVAKEKRKNAEKYNQELKLYEEARSADSRRIDQELQEKARIEELIDRLIDKQNSTYSVLQSYYNANVIFPKYRTLTCVCSIYEYFLSGRCSVLKGHEGAYNLLESDIKYGVIISKLDEVLTRLDDIKMNQSLLYDVVCEGNQLTDKLLRNTIKQTKIQEYNAEKTAVAAYYAKQAANETEQLKWLKWFENVTK